LQVFLVCKFRRRFVETGFVVCYLQANDTGPRVRNGLVDRCRNLWVSNLLSRLGSDLKDGHLPLGFAFFWGFLRYVYGHLGMMSMIVASLIFGYYCGTSNTYSL
jgi:hypothetical protein